MSRDPRYAKRYRTEVALTGQRRTVPTGPVREHVQGLLRQMSMSAIASCAGVSRDVVGTALYRDSMYRAHARALLAVRGGLPGDLRYVSAVGTARRLQALAVLGYSARTVAEAVGVTEKTITTIRAGASGPWVYSTTAQDVARFYDRHSMTPAPSATRSGRATVIAVARRNGWVPPLAWDDAAIDDPAATPDGAGYKAAPLAEQIRELAAMGLSEPAIVDRLHVKPSTVQRSLERGKEIAA